MHWCIKDDLLPERVTKKLDMPRKEVRVIPVFTPTQVNQLFKACERPRDIQYPWIAERDKAIVAVLLDTGIRQAELCGLTLDRVRLDKQDSYIIVFGKGRKEREIGLAQTSRQQLHRYIHRFRPHVSGVNRVFLTRDRRPLAAHGLEAVMLRLKATTGITDMRCSCHDFRHTFAYNYLANGGDLFKLSRLLLGHTDITTTQGYLRAFQSRDARKGFSVLDNLRLESKLFLQARRLVPHVGSGPLGLFPTSIIRRASMHPCRPHSVLDAVTYMQVPCPPR